MSIPTVRQIAANPDEAHDYMESLAADRAELLAALKLLLDKSCEQDDCTAAAYRDAAEQARAAIAKAEGTS